MATLKGIQTNTIYPQPGFAPEQNENGGWEGTHRFVMSRSSFDNFAVRIRFRKGVSVVALDPSIPSFFAFLTIDKTAVEFNEGELCTVVCKFAGAEGAQYGGGGGGSAPLPTYELNCGLSDAPLSEREDWKDLSNDEKTILGYLLSGTYLYDIETEKIQVLQSDGERVDNDTLSDLLTEDAKSFAERIVQGIETYLRPAITWTERVDGTQPLTNDQLNSIGEISTPRGDPPTVGTGRDWMLTSASQIQVGSKYTTFLEWTLSEKGGHDEFLYGG